MLRARFTGPFKKLLASILPARLLFRVKEFHYSRSVPSFWEAEVEPIKCLIKPGDVVLDIGANVGWYSYVFSLLVGGSGKVYSIEPIPETFRLLASIVRKLGLKNVQPLNCAISEADSSAVMEIPMREYGAPNFYQARIIDSASADGSLPHFEVPLRSIDSLFPELPKTVAFIKCDVEGHELSVIKGARHFLNRCKPAWFLEVSGDPDKDIDAKELFGLLKERNYTAYLFDGQKLRKRNPGDKSTNYFFLQPSQGLVVKED